MGLFNKNINETIQITERQALLNKYNSARNNILLIVALTVINIILLVTNSNSYFLFSAYIPFFLVDIAMLLCGMYPAEFYEGTIFETHALPIEVFVVAVVIAVIILVMYVLSWIFSKKTRVGWLIFALIFFSIDTIAMFLINDFAIESIMDYIIHGWVIFYLVKGVLTYRELKKLPIDNDEENIVAEFDDEDTEAASECKTEEILNDATSDDNLALSTEETIE